MNNTPIPFNPAKTIPGVTRYNGGWTKRVTGLDKTARGGYSIEGDFMARGQDLYLPGAVYLDCDVTGSRKKQDDNYRLFRVDADGTPEILARSSRDRGRSRDRDADNWAIALWPAIESALAEFAAQQAAASTKPNVTNTQREVVRCVVDIVASPKLRAAYDERLRAIRAGGDEKVQRDCDHLLAEPEMDAGELLCLVLGRSFETFVCGNGTAHSPIEAEGWIDFEAVP